MKKRYFSGVLVLALGACSGRRLPPGTPPPEYESPTVTPWQSTPADGGASRDHDAAPEASSASGPDLSLDAGVR